MGKIIWADQTTNDALMHGSPVEFFIPMPELSSTEHKINEFRNLKEGWNFGEGKAISLCAIELAIKIARMATPLMDIKTDAFPGLDGGVIFSVYPFDYKSNRHILDLEIHDNGSINWTHELDDEETSSEKDIKLDEVLAVIKKFKAETCNYYEFSQKDIGRGMKTDSNPWRLSPLEDPVN